MNDTTTAPSIQRQTRSRGLLYGVAALIAGGILWAMFYPDYERSRCASLGMATVLANTSSNHAPLAPDDADWYREHCWQGAPRP